MPIHWRKRIQLEPWQHLEMEVRSLPTRGEDNEGRLRASIREVIRAEGGRRVTKSTISFDPNKLSVVASALQEAVQSCSDETVEPELPIPPTEQHLESLLEYVAENARVCPLPDHWNRIWEMLPNRVQRGAGWEPSLPLILGGWWESSDMEKRECLAEHIRWAFEKEDFWPVDQALRELREDEWHREGE